MPWYDLYTLSLFLSHSTKTRHFPCVIKNEILSINSHLLYLLVFKVTAKSKFEKTPRQIALPVMVVIA